jgi:ADP-heptose:LPS heptosyltransferase
VIVAYRALGLGDFLTGVPALRALRRAFPDERLVLAAPWAIEPLAALSGAVDAVVDTPPLGDAPAGADVAVNLHGRGPQSHRVLQATRPGRLIAFANAEVGHDGPRWRAWEWEPARWCRLLTESAIAADPDDLDLAPPRVRSPAPGATVIHPGAASPARRWPVARWAQVARTEAAGGRDVVVTGGPDERALAGAVAASAGLPAAAVLAGRTDLAGLAALVAAAGRVVCGDTGVAHLATAYRVPSVVLFGPTPPAEWGPPPDRPWHRVLWAGRRGDPHAGTPDAGLLEIAVEDVLAALNGDGLGSRSHMSITDKITGRVKKAAGDLTDDAELRRQGRKEERKGEAKDELARAQDKADRKADEVANLERRT